MKINFTTNRPKGILVTLSGLINYLKLRLRKEGRMQLQPVYVRK